MAVYCCGKILDTNFCPECGTNILEAHKRGETPYPYRFTIYLHGEKCDESKNDVIEELGLPDGHRLINEIIGCDYEVALTYEIVDENSGVKLVEVDGHEIK